eukprot:SAG31_NODE_1445_length_8320_cov_3.454081_11_plen_96_part_00
MNWAVERVTPCVNSADCHHETVFVPSQPCFVWQDGASIAWAIVEALLGSSAYVLFVTHFDNLVELERLYDGVQNHHMVGTFFKRIMAAQVCQESL